MNQSIDPRAVSKAINTLGSEDHEFKIEPETTIQSIFDRLLEHEKAKVVDRVLGNMYLSGEPE